MSARSRFCLGVALALALIGAVSTSAFAQKATVTFLHVNDVYELSPKQGKGGFAPLMTLLKQERAKASNGTTITTLGGDLIASSMMSGITKGTQMIELTNAIGMDVAVVGNHELGTSGDIAWVRAWGNQPIPGLVRRGPTNCAATTYSFDHGLAHFVAQIGRAHV